MKIAGAGALGAFRSQWSAHAVLGLLPQHRGRLLISWNVGVGKSWLLDNIIDDVLSNDVYDLVLALFPTYAVIEERRVVRDHQLYPEGLVVKLTGRPSKKCGVLDSAWVDYESRGLGLLGRHSICERCPNARDCGWLKQYEEANFERAKVVIGTHAHLLVNTEFVDFIARKADAGRVLLLIDEDAVAKVSFRCHIAAEDLDRLFNVFKDVDPGDHNWCRELWVLYLESLMAADEELLCDDWEKAPQLIPELHLAVQKLGCERFGDDFFDFLYKLQGFYRSPTESREIHEDGSISFALVPQIHTDTIFFSATADPDLLKHRMGVEFGDPFKDYQFVHPETVWYNISHSAGSAKNFIRNAKQILFFFAQLAALRVRQGKRVLLVSKKDFVDFCAQELDKQFESLGVACRVVTDLKGSDREAVLSQDSIPIIHYGVVGINRFKNFDCVFCMNSYNTKVEILEAFLQGDRASSIRIPLKINYDNRRPLRRTAFAVNPDDRIYDVHRLAGKALYELEMGVVQQVVGRVRPFTSKAEVITFQSNDCPVKGGYAREFESMDDAREFFSLTTLQRHKKNGMIATIRACKTARLTQKETAEKIGISVRTVARYWKEETDE